VPTAGVAGGPAGGTGSLSVATLVGETAPATAGFRARPAAFVAARAHLSSAAQRRLERWPEPYAQPRAVHLDDEVARLLAETRIADQLFEIGEPADRYERQNGQILDPTLLFRKATPDDQSLTNGRASAHWVDLRAARP
jgi:hypothetical protein